LPKYLDVKDDADMLKNVAELRKKNKDFGLTELKIITVTVKRLSKYFKISILKFSQLN
jgi:hypothetical protein